MTLGNNIKRIRKEAKLSQEDFAEKFCVTRQTVSNWENSKSYPDLETIIRAIPHRKKVPNTAECDIIKSWINR